MEKRSDENRKSGALNPCFVICLQIDCFFAWREYVDEFGTIKLFMKTV
jgi:hypothetical protein